MGLFETMHVASEAEILVLLTELCDCTTLEAEATITCILSSLAGKITETWLFLAVCVCVSTALKYSVALCQQKCNRRGTLESNYCSSNFGKNILWHWMYCNLLKNTQTVTYMVQLRSYLLFTYSIANPVQQIDPRQSPQSSSLQNSPNKQFLVPNMSQSLFLWFFIASHLKDLLDSLSGSEGVCTVGHSYLQCKHTHTHTLSSDCG